MIPGWLVQLIQQFGKEVITGAPDAARAARDEVQILRDPYVDNWAHFFGPAGAAEHDAAEHRLYDEMTADQKRRLADLQIRGELRSWNSKKPMHRRPWTGGYELLLGGSGTQDKKYPSILGPRPAFPGEGGNPDPEPRKSAAL